MADRVKFGPAGFPIGFKGGLLEVPAYLRSEGLDAFEYQAVRWGMKPKIRRENAEKFRMEALKHDLWVTVHGSYFINLSGRDEVVRKSIGRLKACIDAAGWLGAIGVVFHPGFYGGSTPEDALRRSMNALKKLVEYIESGGLRVHLLPETTGKPSQLGSLDEVLEMSQAFDLVNPTIDWAHIHARSRGILRSKEDFMKVFERIEKALGSRGVKNLHSHFTHVEYGVKGEIKHRTLEEPYGPSFRPLAEIIVENGYEPVIISESPILDIDSVKMKHILESIRTGRY